MHRHYTPEPVPEELLERLVYAAGRAPVAREGLRHIVVVTEPAVMASIRLVAPGFYNNAPALIAVCADLALATEVIGAVTADEVCALDAGAAGAYLSLAALKLGLASAGRRAGRPRLCRPCSGCRSGSSPTCS